MSKLGKYTRRTFLVGAAAITGGIAFGVYKAKTPFDNRLERDLAEGAVTFNPWVLIDDTAVTLVLPHADKGQGIYSMQAALIAEELDIELDQVETTFGMPDKAYYNGGMSGEMVPIMPTNQSGSAEFARNFAGGAMKLFMPMMMTGGSSSVPDTYEKLREAGAMARETLKRAAAQETGIDVAKLTTKDGAVHLPDGESLAYTALAKTAANVDPVTSVDLRPADQWRILGKDFDRLDIVAKSTGTLEYSIDYAAEDMVYASVRVNPAKGSGLNSFDATEAKTMRGVSQVLEVTNGVAVIADNTWRAIQAVNAIEFDWKPSSYPAEQADHWAALEGSFIEDKINATPRDVGSVDEAEGDLIQAEYRSPYVAHAPLEPLSATILVQDDRVDIWTGHQIQLAVGEQIAAITGHAIEDVHLHNMFMGGSFGHRLEFLNIHQAAEIGNQMRGTPVKLTFSREEDFAQDFPRHITMGRGQGRVADGKVVSLDLQLAAPSVIASQMGRMGISLPGPDAMLHAGAWENPYHNLENLRIRSYKADPLSPVSSWRSVGAAPNGFAFDTLLDELINAAGADPLEERIRLMGHDPSVKVLEAVGDMSNWGTPLGANKGRGVAFVLSFGVPTAEVVEVTNTPDGIKIDKVFVAADVGKVLDPSNFENLVQGGVVYGLGHAINSEITYSNGAAEQANYWDAEGMRMAQCPEIQVRGLENGTKVRGIGEPPVPPAAPALGNAIFAATGQRIREMPFNKFIDFV